MVSALIYFFYKEISYVFAYVSVSVSSLIKSYLLLTVAIPTEMTNTSASKWWCRTVEEGEEMKSTSTVEESSILVTSRG
ncbi:hypothetical protein CFP56_042195 [Quercus suber]|uniref:Uncharacterized protein n=1 Tax=Quercus suber TaxID=58331 RepID=A0AAW0M899_QUESU